MADVSPVAARTSATIAGDSCTVTMDDDRTVDPTFTRFPVICSAGETRCVAEDIEAVQACDACGATWVQGTCGGAYSLCSDSAWHHFRTGLPDVVCLAERRRGQRRHLAHLERLATRCSDVHHRFGA